MGGHDDGGAAQPALADHLEGGLDAERVDTVERLVEQQDRRIVERGEHDRHPAAHAVREPGRDPVGGAREVEAFEQVLGALLPPVGQAAQPRSELEVLPGRRPRDQPADVGAVADLRPRVLGVRDGVDPGHPDDSRRSGAARPARTRRVVDFPAPLRPTRATASRGRDGQVEGLDRRDVAEGHGQPGDLDGGTHGRVGPAQL